MLSHAASAMGVVAAENAFGKDSEFPFNLVPRALWTVPEVGAVGITEEEADKQEGEIFLEKEETMELKDKVAIITGASSGIGRAVARNLNEAGVRLVLTGRREERLAALAAELTHTVTLSGDIVNSELPNQLLRTALDTFGRCDIVFNNAGILKTGSIEDVSIDELCYMVRVNVEAAYRLAYLALKHFKSTGSGFLLNTSSVLGTKVRPSAGAYAGTKYAIEALTEGLRIEVAKTDIGVACVEPGLVETELQRDWGEPASKRLNISRPLQPTDIARVVRFVLEQPEHVRIQRVLVMPTDHDL